MKNIYLRLNGIPTNEIIKDDEVFFIYNQLLGWGVNKGELNYEIDCKCVEIHDALANKIFVENELYWIFLKHSPPYLQKIVYETGLNSESIYSKDEFSILISKLNSYELNQALYLSDCRKLVSGIQECNKEISQLQGEFYRALNLDELFELPPSYKEPDGLNYATSKTVTNIHATLGFIFIRLHSLLDYITKLAFEITHLRNDFSSYPKLASKNVQYKHRNKISFNNAPNTLFEKCSFLTKIETIRNHLIHDGLLDDMPKVYKLVLNGSIIEKFVPFPDISKDGYFESCKNRNLFYSQDNKINLHLPKIIKEFQERQMITLELILEELKSK